MIIKGIIEESRSHYQTQFDHVLGRLIHIPRGSLRKKCQRQKAYWYLRRHVKEKGYVDIYIGPDSDKAVQNFIAFVRERQTRMEEFKAIKAALKELGVNKMELQQKGYPEMLQALVDAFGAAGLWREGLMLVGSWSFDVYVQAFGVEYFPLRTMDFDFGLRIPYQGGKADIDDLLKRLGFTAQIDMAYDKVNYVLPGVGMVEVFVDRQIASSEHIRSIKENLSLRPAVLSYLQILIDHPVSVKLHGLHSEIIVPSMPSFFIHKLITAKFGEYRDPILDINKTRKDYKQAALVAKKIFGDEALRDDLKIIKDGLSDKLRNKMAAGANAAADFTKAPDLSVEDVRFIHRILNI
jgi:hypothetical protein